MGILSICYGRFQWPHKGHEHMIREAMKRGDKTLLLVGSSGEARSLDNPLTYTERLELLREIFHKEVEEGKLYIRPLLDFKYNDVKWFNNTIRIINEACDKFKMTPLMIGVAKDATTADYLDSFSRYMKVEYIKQETDISDIDLRNDLYGTLNFDTDAASKPVVDFLVNFKRKPEFFTLASEHQAVLDYHKSWEGSPFSPVFVAVDGVCVIENVTTRKRHILLVTRKSEFGNGLYALPGGYIEADEKILTSCLRELREETNFHPNEEAFFLKDVTVIDEPKRSKRGRMITHVHLFQGYRKDDSKPTVIPGDDAATAIWFPMDDLEFIRDRMFADHFHIIRKVFPWN